MGRPPCNSQNCAGIHVNWLRPVWEVRRWSANEHPTPPPTNHLLLQVSRSIKPGVNTISFGSNTSCPILKSLKIGWFTHHLCDDFSLGTRSEVHINIHLLIRAVKYHFFKDKKYLLLSTHRYCQFILVCIWDIQDSKSFIWTNETCVPVFCFV